jgi:hypothetical protein
VGLAALTVLTSVTACSDDDDKPEPAPPPLAWKWTEARLPMPSGSAVSNERIVVRDVVSCGTQWYAVGGLSTPANDTRPAIWRSADGATWESLPLTPQTFYGRQHILYSVACRRDGVVGVLGAKRGGAHAYPRTSHWRMTAEGPLTEVISAFELYGGPDAGNVARMVAGPPGFLIAGNRMTGAAAWTSVDANEFVLRSGVPPLAGGTDLFTAAADATADAAGWTLVGGASKRGRTDRDPVAWTSTDGATWQRVDLAGDKTYEDLQRVVRVGDDVLATGVKGEVFGAWLRRGGQWQAVGTFGSVRGGVAASGPTTVGGVVSTAVRGPDVLAAVSDGGNFSVWRSGDTGGSWQRVALPAEQPAGAERSLTVAGSGTRWLVAGDDAKQGRIWFTDQSQ